MKIEENLTESTKKLKASIDAEEVQIIFSVDPSIETWEAWWHRNPSRQIVRTFEITANSEVPNPAALAHELLHARLDLDGFWVPQTAFRQLHIPPVVLSPDYLDGCYNNLEHHFMITEFEDLGLDRLNFLHPPISSQLDQVRETVNELCTSDEKNTGHFVVYL